MEDMFVWILVFAGAVIGLLGIFLISSERELKRKRREVEEFAARLESGETASAFEKTAPAPAEETEQTAELIARNKALEDEVNSLSSRLRQSETASEELAVAENQLSASRLENVELQKSSQQLQEEIGLLKKQLEMNVNQLNQSGDEHAQIAVRTSRYEAENTGLRNELEQSRQKIQDLENRQAQWAGVKSREALMKEQQQRLEGEITQLNQQLTVAREAAHESAAAQAQLRESETSRKQLLDDNQRLQQEISRWQERLAGSEQRRRQLTAFRHNLEQLKTKQAAVIETHRQLQEELGGLARFVESSEGAADVGLSPSETALPANGQDSFRNEPNGRGATTEMPQPDGNSGASLSPETTNASEVKRRRFGIFSAIVALTVGGGLAAGFLQ